MIEKQVSLGEKRVTITVVMASYNRRNKTLLALKSLEHQNTDRVNLCFLILDDASTDGTAEAVSHTYPNATIVRGTGSLFWGGGMHLAMKRAIEGNPDFLIMMNDDCELFESAIDQILADYHKVASETDFDGNIVVGAMVAPGTGKLTYSGFRRASRWFPSKLERLEPDGSPKPADTMNGNFVLIPRRVYRALGPVDNVFIHQLGDIDYGYRAVAHGFRIWIASTALGECASNEGAHARISQLSLRESWTHLCSPLGMPLFPWLSFMWRHGGVLGVLQLPLIYIRYIQRFFLR